VIRNGKWCAIDIVGSNDFGQGTVVCKVEFCESFRLMAGSRMQRLIDLPCMMSVKQADSGHG
jgi:hypothetical protein